MTRTWLITGLLTLACVCSSQAGGVEGKGQIDRAKKLLVDGQAQTKMALLEMADKSFREALSILQSQVQDSPANTDLQQELVRAYRLLGGVQLATGRGMEAAESSQQALQLVEALSFQVPLDIAVRRDLVDVLQFRAEVLGITGHLDEAKILQRRVDELRMTIETPPIQDIR